MQRRVTIFAGVASAFLLQSVTGAAADDQSCKLRRVASLEMSYEGGHPHIPISIGGEKVDMAIDTGAIFSVINEKTAKTLALPLDGLAAGNFRMFNGTRLTYGASAKDIKIGAVPIPRYDFMVMPESVHLEGDGLIGPDILSVFDIDLDFSANRANFFAPSECGDGVVYWAGDYAVLPLEFDQTNVSNFVSKHIFTHATLDGRDIRILIDTGAPISVMTLVQANHVFGVNTADLKPVADKNGAPTGIYTYPFKTLTVGGITITNPRIMIKNVRNGQLDRDEDMILGLDTLHKLHVYISYKQRKMYVTPASAIPAAK